MIAYLRGEPGADIVESRLEDDSKLCVAHAVNLCEIYYKALGRSGVAGASSAIQDLKDVGLGIRADLDEAFWQDVASHKASLRNSIPLADCFMVALANRLSAEALTADHPAFDAVDENGLCQVRFIR
jgi:predicted nucleic acid-binding protein